MSFTVSCLLQLLAHALLSGIHHARLMQRQHKYNREKKAPQGDMLAPSMRRAKNLASDLLNMSSSDIDDLLSVCDDTDDSLKVCTIIVLLLLTSFIVECALFISRP